MQPFNKYYPPDWTPDKGTVNSFVGKHPLGSRARKIDKGILILRFELPFNIWCDGCGEHIAMGVRFNAEKKKIGMYHSTSIWQFRMKCHLCDNWIEIHTDPKTTQYLVISGARKKIEEWEPEDSEVIKLKDEETAEKLAADAFYRLEHTVTDEKKREEALPALTRLQRLNETQWSDPYALSQKLRKKFREDKMLAKMEERVAEEIRDRNSLHIPLLPKSEEDEIKAKTTEFADHVLEQAEKRKLEIAASSIFNQDKKRRRTSGPLDDVRSGTTPRSVVKELGVLATVHTKLKIDPFLSTVGFGRVAQAVRDGDTGNVAADAAGGLVGLVRVKEKAETKALAKTRVTNPRTDIVDKDGVNKSKDFHHQPSFSLTSLVSVEYGDDDAEDV